MAGRRRKPAPADSTAGADLLVVRGWRIGFHTEILLQLEALIAAVERERRKDPQRARQSQPALILAHLRKLMFEEIPEDPGREIYRQGKTLGAQRKHWFRAKFGRGRYRLFFRYHSRERILVFAWVNDEETLRTYGSATNAYATFARKLDQGNPPADWNALLRDCTTPDTIRRLERILQRMRGMS